MRSLVYLLCCIIALTVLAGCGGGGGGSSSRLQLFLTDAPIDAYAINVTISSIEVHSDANGWQTIKDYDPALTINLLDYQAKNDLDSDPGTIANYLLLDQPLSPGHYTMIRLHVTEVRIVVNEGDDPAGVPVDINNLEQTGIKLNHEFDVPEGEVCAVLLDFNGKESIVEMGNGNYRLQPVIAAVPKNVVGRITGTVVFKDASEVVVPVPAPPVTVGAYASGTTTLVSIGEVVPSVDGLSGAFTIGALLPGTYDIKVTATGYSSDAVRLAVVTLGAAETKSVEVVVLPP